MEGRLAVLQGVLYSGPADHLNIGILQTVVSGTPLSWSLEPECRILAFLRSSRPPNLAVFMACLGEAARIPK